MQKVWAKINLHSIQTNAKAFHKITNRPLYAVVKANAYGHGAEMVAAALSGVAHGFAVALIDEALAIRTASCGKEILVFTPPTTEEEVYTLAVNGFVATIPDLWTAKLVQAVCAKRQLPLCAHLKVNTGMNRYGCNHSQLGKICKALYGDNFVQVQGVYSHLYTCAYEVVNAQRESFLRAERIVKNYYPQAKAHLSATYGCLLGKQFTFDAVRVGIGLYGYLPIGMGEQEKRLAESLRLQKAMTVYASVTARRNASYGGVGYGMPCLTEKQALSVLRVGYADGFLRRNPNGLLGAQDISKALCMDAAVVNGQYRRGRKVAVLSDAEEIAAATDTISYEVLCAATRRAEFVYAYE